MRLEMSTKMRRLAVAGWDLKVEGKIIFFVIPSSGVLFRTTFDALSPCPGNH